MIHTFKVGHTIVTMVPLSAGQALEQGIDGSYVAEGNILEMAVNQTPSVQAATLIHELLHACFDVYHLKTSRLSEEAVCTALDGPLTALFTDNPLLAGMLHQAVNHGKPILETSI